MKSNVKEFMSSYFLARKIPQFYENKINMSHLPNTLNITFC